MFVYLQIVNNKIMYPSPYLCYYYIIFNNLITNKTTPVNVSNIYAYKILIITKYDGAKNYNYLYWWNII